MRFSKTRLTLLVLLVATLLNVQVAWPRSWPISTKHAMVATQHRLATRVAMGVLRRGGSAVDAGIAAAFALAVVEPYNSGLGGGGFALYYDPSLPAPLFLDFRERAPQGARPEVYLQDGEPQSEWLRKGWKAVGVPGEIAGLFELHRRAGTTPIAELIKPAERLAREGFAVDPILAQRLKDGAALLQQDADLERIFFKSGVTGLGSWLVQRQLADTLRGLRCKGSKYFYGEKAAQKFEQLMKAHGGLITAEDLRSYQPKWREPLRGTYRDLEIVSAPPPSSGGGVLLEALGILQNADLAKLEAGSAASLHLMAQALSFAFHDRARFYGDPEFVSVPLEQLLSPERAQKRFELLKKRGDRALSAEEIAKHETTHLVVVDGKGRALSMTLTLNTSFGAAVALPGTGVILNNEMDDFSLPGTVNSFGLTGEESNAIAPGKTPLSSMAPTFLFQEGRLRMVLGSPGGPRIISSVLGVIVNSVDFKMNVRDAVQVPRIHHQWQPDVLYVEDEGIPPEVITALKRKGHQIEEQHAWGNVQAIEIVRDEGTAQHLEGASDDRGQGTAAGF